MDQHHFVNLRDMGPARTYRIACFNDYKKPSLVSFGIKDIPIGSHIDYICFAADEGYDQLKICPGCGMFHWVYFFWQVRQQ